MRNIFAQFAALKLLHKNATHRATSEIRRYTP